MLDCDKIPSHMKLIGSLLLLAVAAFAQDVVWAPKADVLPKYTPPHKPHTKLADVKAKHSGEANWTELVVNDDLLRGEYISSAPGSKISRRFHPDTREFWIILDGQIRYDIEG